MGPIHTAKSAGRLSVTGTEGRLLRNEEERLLGVRLDGGEEVGLLHAEEVVELGILTEQDIRIYQ